MKYQYPFSHNYFPRKVKVISDGNHEHNSDTDFVDILAIELENFNHAEFNDLFRDFGLSKELSELLASRFRDKNMLQKEANVTFYRNREEYLLAFFKNEKKILFTVVTWRDC